MTDTLQEKRRTEPAWLSDLRSVSGDHFASAEWPTPSEEEWRRTDLSSVDIDSMLDASSHHDETELPSVSFETAARLVFIDGNLAHSSQSDDFAETGARLESLDEAIDGDRAHLARQLLEQAVSQIDNRFQSLNYSKWDHGALVTIPPQVRLDKPILVDIVASGEGTVKPHILVHAGVGSESLVVQRYVTAPDAQNVLMDAAWEVQVEENGRCDLATIEHLDSTSLFIGNGYAGLQAYASLNSFEVFTGGKIVKSRFVTELAGAGSDAVLSGLFLAGKGSHLDLRTVQRHTSPKAGSRSFYFGAAAETGRSVFQGLIEVAKDASGTDAYLTNKNLILDDTARADAIPSLAIKTNDVRCSHGSSTGKIDEDQLFYLMNRGFSRIEARNMLIDGFFEEAIGRAPEVIRDELRGLVSLDHEDSDG